GGVGIRGVGRVRAARRLVLEAVALRALRSPPRTVRRLRAHHGGSHDRRRAARVAGEPGRQGRGPAQPRAGRRARGGQRRAHFVSHLYLVKIMLLLLALLAASAPAKHEWLGTEMPLPLSVRTSQDLEFKSVAEKQYLIFNLLASGKVAWDAGDYAT